MRTGSAGSRARVPKALPRGHRPRHTCHTHSSWAPAPRPHPSLPPESPSHHPGLACHTHAHLPGWAKPPRAPSSLTHCVQPLTWPRPRPSPPRPNPEVLSQVPHPNHTHPSQPLHPDARLPPEPKAWEVSAEQLSNRLGLLDPPQLPTLTHHRAGLPSRPRAPGPLSILTGLWVGEGPAVTPWQGELPRSPAVSSRV